MKKILFYSIPFAALILSFVHPLIGTAQSVKLATDGEYVPRLTTAQRTAITAPTSGQMIYNTDDNCFNVYQNNAWQKLCGFDVTLSDIWKQKANFGGTGRYGAVGFSIGTKGYIGTGLDDGVRKNDFWEYDPVGNSWTQKANFGGTARNLAVGFSIGSKGYIGTGVDGGNKNDFWEYDPIGNSWTQKANFAGTARSSAVGFSIGSKGYIGTGGDGGYKNDFWEYDPIGNSWTQKANFGGTARVAAVGFSIGSKGYIGTGNDGGYKNDFWEYNPIGNSWTQKTNFAGTERFAAVGFSIGSKGYIGTGVDGGLKNDFWEYDPIGNSWTQKASFGGTARYAAVGFSIDSKGYIGTGLEGFNGVNKNDFWEYDPASPINITQQGNVFNGNNQLVQTDGAGKVPTSVLPTNTTQQGNAFNGASQLVQLNAAGYLGLGGATANAPLQFNNDFSTNRKIVLYEGANNEHQFYGLGINSGILRYQVNTTGDDHVFYAGIGAASSNEVFRIKGNGNVGIGVINPSNTLEVAGNTKTTTLQLTNGATNNALLRSDANGVGSWKAASTVFPKITAYSINIGRNAFTPFIDFSNDNSVDFDARIKLTGDDELQVQGVSTFNVLGAFQSNGNTFISDRRFKKDFIPIPNSLAKILKINGLHYFYKTDEFKERSFSKEKQIGFIAQDIEPIFPELVLTDAQGYKSVDYARFTPILVEAMKEQQHDIAFLKNASLKIEKIATDNEAIKKEIEALKNRILKVKNEGGLAK